MNCDICNMPLVGVYYIDRWGTKAHSHHNGLKTSRCYCCGKYIDHTDRRKSLLYGDGRTICRFCHDNAVNTVATGAKVKKNIFNMFRNAGIALPEERIKLIINDKKYAKESLGRESFHGLMKASSVSSIFGIKTEYTINIISGLHYVIFNGVFAHELMHVYILENGISLSHIEEEGLCELICYYLLEVSKAEIGLIEMQSMLESTDPIYGDGFRMMKNKIDKAGSWKKLMKCLR